jgi:thioredoxin 1
MNKVWKTAIVVVLVAVVAIVIINKQRGPSPGTDPAKGAAQVSQPAAGLPRLLDLGSTTCIPCKMMAPILEDLKTSLAGRLDVQFIDVSLPENRPLAQQYKIELIPTQVLLAPDGRELWRHEGFLGKEDILAKWKELGYDFGAGG